VRRRAPRPLAHALAGVTATLAPPTTLARVQGCWADVVGETLVEECRPLSEREGVVTVSCRSAVWAQELSMMAPELVERLNGALAGDGGRAAVAELRFRVGSQL
jgi:predicted nucleic acid-binding Zn ribbon protein